jgi:hypothetical protein
MIQDIITELKQLLLKENPSILEMKEGSFMKYVFQDENHIEHLLKLVKISPFFLSNDINKKVVLILAVDKIQQEIRDTPCSIKDIFSIGVSSLIEEGKTSSLPSIDEDEE